MTIKNPCKDEKCILYPICITKKEIKNCDKLDDYLSKILKRSPTFNPNSKYHDRHENLLLWKEVLTFLPNVKVLNFRRWLSVYPLVLQKE